MTEESKIKLWPTDGLAEYLRNINTHEKNFSILTNGQIIEHPWFLDGGGGDYRHYFLKTVAKNGWPKYKNAFEWCCGHTIIGFELLTQGYCDNLFFNDYYDLAVKNSIENAEKLGFKNNVKGYITPKISEIPVGEKWDLVVGNPPNTASDHGMRILGKNSDWDEFHITHALRLSVDMDYEIHKEFFKNIKNYITPDADIFLTMHETTFSMFEKEIYGPNGFVITSITDMIPRDPSLKIAQFKIRE